MRISKFRILDLKETFEGEHFLGKTKISKNDTPINLRLV